MVRCKAGKALRSGKNVSYTCTSSDEGQSRTPRTGEMAVSRHPALPYQRASRPSQVAKSLLGI